MPYPPIESRSDVNRPSGKATSNALTPREEDIVSILGLTPEDAYSDESDGVIVLGKVNPDEMAEAWEMGVDLVEDMYYRSCENFSEKGTNYAIAGVSYMLEKGHNLELVKPGLFHSSHEEQVEMIHFNFRAVRADDPNAPVETYFGQLHHYWNGNPAFVVDCCVSLGKCPPPTFKRDVQECELCWGKLVHHPVGGCEGIDWGHARWGTSCYEW